MITERRETDDYVGFLMDALPALVSYVDAGCRYRFNNRAYREWFGIERHELIGKTMSEVLGAEAFARLKPGVDCALAGERVNFDAELPYRFGGTRFVHVDYVPDAGPDGAVRGFHVFVTDLSERKKAETIQAQELADLTRLQQMTVRLGTHDDLEPMLADALEGAMTLTGASAGSVSILDTSGALAVVVQRGADPPSRGGASTIHSTPLLSRDERVLGRIDLQRDTPGEPAERSVRLVDLLARHAAGHMEHLQLLQSARSSEERFREMADAAPAILWVTDESNYLTFISRGWYEYTGQTKEEVYEGGFGWTKAVHPEDADRAASTFQNASDRREAFELEYRLRQPDGSYRWALDAGRPRFGADGRWTGYVGSVIDIHDITEARESLRLADRRKDEFLATLAHELRNPLAPIRNALHLLNSPGGAVYLERVREMLGRQVNQMVRLVDDLMEASRITTGKLELQREQIDLREAIRAAVETARPLIERNHHALDVTLPKEPLMVDGDGVRLAQVFANLLNNAAKYSEPGGQIRVFAQQGAGTIRVAVADQGVGIAPHDLPRLFELFVQLDRSHAKNQGGLGIGLNLSRRLVELHGGELTAASAGEGLGSEFTVVLPGADFAADSGVTVAPASTSYSRRIMVIDDNRDAAESLAMLLVSLGAEVKVFFDGRTALASADWCPEVVFLDLGMPGMDGFEVARHMRAHPAFRDTWLVALTGWGQEEDKRRTKASGFDEHWTKPIDMQALEAILGRKSRV